MEVKRGLCSALVFNLFLKDWKGYEEQSEKTFWLCQGAKTDG